MTVQSIPVYRSKENVENQKLLEHAEPAPVVATDANKPEANANRKASSSSSLSSNKPAVSSKPVQDQVDKSNLTAGNKNGPTMQKGDVSFPEIVTKIDDDIKEGERQRNATLAASSISKQQVTPDVHNQKPVNKIALSTERSNEPKIAKKDSSNSSFEIIDVEIGSTSNDNDIDSSKTANAEEQLSPVASGNRQIPAVSDDSPSQMNKGPEASPGTRYNIGNQTKTSSLSSTRTEDFVDASNVSDVYLSTESVSESKTYTNKKNETIQAEASIPEATSKQQSSFNSNCGDVVHGGTVSNQPSNDVQTENANSIRSHSPGVSLNPSQVASLQDQSHSNTAVNSVTTRKSTSSSESSKTGTEDTVQEQLIASVTALDLNQSLEVQDSTNKESSEFSADTECAKQVLEEVDKANKQNLAVQSPIKPSSPSLLSSEDKSKKAEDFDKIELIDEVSSGASESKVNGNSTEVEGKESPKVKRNRVDVIFHSGWRKLVKLVDLINARLVSEKTAEQLEAGEIEEKDVADDLQRYLNGYEPIAGLLLMDTGEKMSFYDASKKRLVRRGTVVSLLEAQAATGSIINPYSGEKMDVEEAEQAGLIDKYLSSVLVRAQRAAFGFNSKLSDKPLSLFEAMKRNLVVESHGIRLLEAQVATGGIIDPWANHRLPVDVAYERGLFDERLNKILENPADDTKGFFDPNTNQNLTYLQLIERCIVDKETSLKLLPLYKEKQKKDYWKN